MTKPGEWQTVLHYAVGAFILTQKVFYLLTISLAASFFLFPAAGMAQEQLPLPPRASDALSGSQIYTQLLGKSLTQQEEFIFHQIRNGNVPSFIRTLIPITITENISASNRTAMIYVTPDYMSVGSNTDFFRIPMTASLAQWTADLCSSSLTTRKVTDVIYTESTVKLAPQFFNPADFQIDSWEIIYQHNLRIEELREGNALGLLVGGIKKDVVITQRLTEQLSPPRIAIYGWHQLNGSPIQPLSLIHIQGYRDYSHGSRLILNEMLVDGMSTTVQAVLTDPDLHVLLSDEGVFPRTRYDVPLPPISQEFPFIDSFSATGKELPFWDDRFKSHSVVPFSPVSPGGDGYVLRVRDTSGGIDTSSIGDGDETDYYVEADIYCDFRPELLHDGFDRVGIFARDNGNGLFTGSSFGGIPGNCYGIAWDSSDGRLWCFKTVGGVIEDLNPDPVYDTESGWRRMRVELEGSKLRFFSDSELILETTDFTHTSGRMGIGYQEAFSTNTNITGTYADNFIADLIPDQSDQWLAY